MFYLIVGAVLVAAIFTIGLLVGRKLPLLSTLDVATIPAEREARKKKEIITRRLEERVARFKTRLEGRLGPLLRRWWGALQLKFRTYVGRVERLWYHEEHLETSPAPRPPAGASSAPERGRDIIAEAELCLQNHQNERAEELFIVAIKLDTKNAAAYRGLADTYAERGLWDEARETYRYVLSLEPDDDSVMVRLASIAERQGDLEEAIAYYQRAVLVNDSLSSRFFHLAELLLKVQQPLVAKEAVSSAVELEPKNPKYLDLALETAILCGDRALGRELYEQLRLVNPENRKLAEFAERLKKP